MPWFHYFLSTIVSAYKEFEQRAGNVKNHRGAKTELVRQAILNQVGNFSVSDIERECPEVSHDMVRVIFRQLQKEKKLSVWVRVNRPSGRRNEVFFVLA